jgi:4-hydroxy-4-methyl-2-oxoglutarate aldolase
VWSRHVFAEGTTKGNLGDVNVPISIAGQIVHPGDAVLADDDGVVIVPGARVAEVLVAAQEREEKEELSRARYLAGEIALDVNNMRPMIEAAGIRYVDYRMWKEGLTS